MSAANQIETANDPKVRQALFDLDDHYLTIHRGIPSNCIKCFALEDSVQQAIENAREPNQTPPHTRP